MRAPRRRARCASRRIGPGDAQLTLHGCGTDWPFVTAVYERKATRTPFTRSIAVLRRARAEREVPVAFTPAPRSACRVESIPDWPASSEWFDAVLHASQPTRLTEPASAGGVWNTGYPWTGPGTSGVSMWQSARSAPAITPRTGANSGAKS